MMTPAAAISQPRTRPETEIEAEPQARTASDEAIPTPIVETLLPYKFDWINASIITLTPIAAVILPIWYVGRFGFQVSDLLSFAVMYFLVGFSVTAGYHRYFSHRSYDTKPWLQFLMLVFGAASLENSALSWSSDHRYHHRYTDREADPYNINKGFFWAHMGWIYFSPVEKRPLLNVLDLKKNRLVMWQHRFYIAIAITMIFVPPLMIGSIFGRPGAGLVWGAIVRLVASHHATFLINSAAHWFGTKPYNQEATARDSWWLAFFSFGEGYHNFHHSYPSDYRNGVRWFEYDPTKWLIALGSKIGWTWNLRKTLKP